MSKMLHRSFQAGKCKTSVKLAMARIKLLRNKREAQLKQMKKELAQLLEAGQEQTARIRVEHVLREEKTMVAYDLIEIYCELIAARLPIIESQKNCPIDLKEAIASVVFASPRCSDLPELSDVRKHFTAKYGKEFIATALELRPECGVSRRMIETLSARTPDGETKIKLLTAIAQDYNVKWDPNQFAEKELKPPEDLLNGPKTSDAAINTPVADPTVQLPRRHDPNYESAVNVSNVAGSARSSQNFEHMENSMRSSYSESRTSVNSAEWRASGPPSSKEQSAFSSNRQNWGMEFKDATSAAQAAAESAERASIAARAAAELSSIGRIRQENSAGPQESFINHYSEDELKKSAGSMSTAEHTEQTVRKDDFLRASSHGMDRRTLYEQGHKNDRENKTRISDGTFDVDEITERRAGRSTQSGTRVDFSDDDILVSNPQKPDVYPQHNSFEVGATNSNWQTADEMEKDVMLNSKLYMDGSDGTGLSSGIGQGNDQIGTKQPTFSNNPAAVFDDSGSDDDCHLSAVSVFSRHEFNSYARSEDQNSPSSPSHVSKHTRSPRRQGGGSFKNSSGQSHFATEPFSPFEFSESKKDTAVPSRSSELPATFDDSDELYSDSDEEDAKEVRVPGRMDSDGLPLEFTALARSLESLQIDRVHDSRRTNSKKKESTESYQKRWLHSPSDELKGYDVHSENNLEAKPNVRGSVREKQEHLQSSSLSPAEEVKETDDFGHTASSKDFHSSVVEEKRRPLQSSQVSLTKELGVRDEGNGQGVPDNMTVSSESGQGLTFGRLTGGFRNKGYIRPPYEKGPSWDGSSQSREQTDEGTSAITEKPFAQLVSRTSMNSEALYQEPSYQKQVEVQHGASARTPKTIFDSDSDDETEVPSYQTAGSSGYSRRGLSQRTRDSAKQSEGNNLPRLTRRSEVPASSERRKSSILSSYDTGSDLRPQTENVGYGSSGESTLRTGTFEEHSMPQSQLRNTQNFKLSTADVSGGQKTIKAQPQNEAQVRDEGSELSQPSSVVKQRSTLHSSTTSRDTITSKSPSLSQGLESRENSLNKASHVHPKLPDYDSFAAHFESLRSNRRSG